MSLGKRIVAARKERGWSRTRLAQESGVPYPTLAGLESGDQKTSTATPMLAAALKLNALWLATGKGERHLTENFSAPSFTTASQIATFDPATLARALVWFDFEEKAAGNPPTQPLRRAERLIALYQMVAEDGGELSPDHAQELIRAADRGQGHGGTIKRRNHLRAAASGE